jgi:hypothetical protein
MNKGQEPEVEKKRLVNEGWLGPGRRDGTIVPLEPAEDGLHIDIHKKGEYEWWYFDAHLETGHTIVVFFYAANPNPGLGGKPGVEITLLRPDGSKTQKLIPFGKSDFKALRDKAEVKMGANHLETRQQPGELPVYVVHVEDQDLSCHLEFKAQVNGWKPGTGLSRFGELGTFAWVVPFARASVTGIINDKGQVLEIKGVGYHDHNWLDFPFPTIIDYWMWGRIYSAHYTISYAFIQCNAKVDHHKVMVLMMADGEEVKLSTGQFEFSKEDFDYDQRANHRYPKKVTISVPNELVVSLRVRKILESQNMLDNFSLPLRLIAKYLLRLRPGYFRLLSDFEINATREGKSNKETGTALHEIVLFRSAE